MQELFSLLQDLVALRSDVNETQTESPVTEYICQYFAPLSHWKVTRQLISVGRENVFVSQSDSPEVVFVGHQDTVPVTDESQLQPRIEGGKLFGRGAVDMKAGLATMLLLAKNTTNPNIAFLFTVDEEYEFLGAQRFIQDNGWKPKLVINPEPTDEKILTQCRGFTEIYLDIEGTSVHAGRKHLGTNAIEKAVELSKILEIELQKFDSGDMKTSVNLAALHGGVKQNGEITIRPNVVPDLAKTVIEIRLGGAELTQEKIKSVVQRLANDLKISLTNYRNDMWFGPMVGNNEEVDSFAQTVKSAGVNPEFLDPNSAGFYEVQLLQSLWHCPVLIFGAGPNAKSHQKDEYVNLESVSRVYTIYQDYLNSLSS